MTGPATPLAVPLEVSDVAPGRGVTSMTIDGALPVLRGHYPGFPILPGVCIVECVRHSAAAVPPAAGIRLTLAAIESTRFQGPVFPGDTLTTELTWAPAGPGWICRARVGTRRGRAAQVRLRYEQRRD